MKTIIQVTLDTTFREDNQVAVQIVADSRFVNAENETNEGRIAYHRETVEPIAYAIKVLVKGVNQDYKDYAASLVLAREPALAEQDQAPPEIVH